MSEVGIDVSRTREPYAHTESFDELNALPIAGARPRSRRSSVGVQLSRAFFGSADRDIHNKVEKIAFSMLRYSLQ